MELTTQAKEQIQIALTQIHADACDLSLDNDVPYHEALSKVFHTLWTKLKADPSKRVTRCKPWSSTSPKLGWAPTHYLSSNHD